MAGACHRACLSCLILRRSEESVLMHGDGSEISDRPVEFLSNVCVVSLDHPPRSHNNPWHPATSKPGMGIQFGTIPLINFSHIMLM